LNDLHKGFDDSVIMTKIIYNLPMKYECLMIAWDNVPKDQWKLDNLMLQLLKEKTKIKRRKEQNHSIGAKHLPPKPMFNLFLDGNTNYQLWDVAYFTY